MSVDTPLPDARTVELRLDRQRLPERMAAMRVWLDEHHFEPSVFACRELRGDLVVSVRFSKADEAEAFAERFAGQLAGPLPAELFVAG